MACMSSMKFSEKIFIYFWHISDICVSSKEVWSNTRFELIED